MTALDRLASTIQTRKGADPESSWTAKLLAKGPEKCAEKFGEQLAGQSNANFRTVDILRHKSFSLFGRDH